MPRERDRTQLFRSRSCGKLPIYLHFPHISEKEKKKFICRLVRMILVDFFLKLSKRYFLLRIKVFKLRTRQSKSKNLFQILESFFNILTVFMSLYGRRCCAFNFNRLHWLQSFLDFGSIFDHSELSSFTFLTFGTILSFFSPTPPPCTVCPLCPFLPHPSFCSATDRSWVTGAFWVIF